MQLERHNVDAIFPFVNGRCLPKRCLSHLPLHSYFGKHRLSTKVEIAASIMVEGRHEGPIICFLPSTSETVFAGYWYCLTLGAISNLGNPNRSLLTEATSSTLPYDDFRRINSANFNRLYLLRSFSLNALNQQFGVGFLLNRVKKNVFQPQSLILKIADSL